MTKSYQLSRAPSSRTTSAFCKAKERADWTLRTDESGTTPFPIGVAMNGKLISSMSRLIGFSARA